MKDSFGNHRLPDPGGPTIIILYLACVSATTSFNCRFFIEIVGNFMGSEELGISLLSGYYMIYTV